MDTKINASQANGLYLGHIGWKYYSEIKKKAMEQEFSWAGLVLILSIAFFIVIISAVSLNLLYESIRNANPLLLGEEVQINRWEGTNYWA